MRKLVTVLVAAAVALVACAPKHIPGTNIEDTQANQEILRVVADYKTAYEAKDAPGVLKLVSRKFYETNGTPDPGDDYDYDGLSKILGEEFKSVQAPALDVDVRKIEVTDDEATVNYYYAARFQLADAGPNGGFKASNDVAQIHLRREQGGWKITSGI